MAERERERERQRQRQRQRQRDRDRETDRQTERQREREQDRDRDREPVVLCSLCTTIVIECVVCPQRGEKSHTDRHREVQKNKCVTETKCVCLGDWGGGREVCLSVLVTVCVCVRVRVREYVCVSLSDI